MKKFLIYLSSFAILSTYFILSVFILPPEFLMTEQLVPKPVFEAVLSETDHRIG